MKKELMNIGGSCYGDHINALRRKFSESKKLTMERYNMTENEYTDMFLDIGMWLVEVLNEVFHSDIVLKTEAYWKWFNYKYKRTEIEMNEKTIGTKMKIEDYQEYFKMYLLQKNTFISYMNYKKIIK